MNSRERYRLFRLIGKALSDAGFNNSHSGNMAMLDGQGTRRRIYITATGAPLSNLIPTDIVPIDLEKTTWGDARASSEKSIYRNLMKTGIRAVIHAHLPNTTLLSFDKGEHFLLSAGSPGEYLFVPIDWMGIYHAGKVPVSRFEYPVGSSEMAERIPEYLRNHKAMIVKGHGPFAGGESLTTVFHTLSILDASAQIVRYAGLLGADIRKLQEAVLANPGSQYPSPPPPYNKSEADDAEIHDATTRKLFTWAARFIYYQGLSPFYTGSMSECIGHRMIYCPRASVPEGFPVVLRKIPLDIKGDEDYELRLHKEIYHRSRFRTIIHTLSPLPNAESLATIERGGDTIKPIDAEALYLNPEIGLVKSNASYKEIVEKLHRYKGVCVIGGVGLIGVGTNTLEQAIHHPASAHYISRYRIEVALNHKAGMGPPLKELEDNTSL